MRNVDFRTLPPCKKTLIQHIWWATWKCADVLNTKIKILEPLCVDSDVVPLQTKDALVDTLCAT